MQHYFAEKIVKNKAVLSEMDIHHITKVMRNKVSDEVVVIYERQEYKAIIESFAPFSLRIKEKLDGNNESSKKIILAFGLLPEQRMDYIFQKGTELGATSFVPLILKNSKININEEKKASKNKRWQLICKEAAEQSHRQLVPEVKPIMKLDELIKIDSDLKIICSLKEKSINFKKVLQNTSNYDTIILVIGSEGGFDSSEEDFLVKYGYNQVSLGKRVLRAETVPLYVLSAIDYELL